MVKDKFSYDDAISEIEAIIQRLQADNVESIDKEIGNIEKAVLLLDKCKEHLTATSERLDKLFEEKD